MILEALSLSKTLASKVKAADVVLEPSSPFEDPCAVAHKSSRRDFGSLVRYATTRSDPVVSLPVIKLPEPQLLPEGAASFQDDMDMEGSEVESLHGW